MPDGGKGSAPRPFSVTQEEYTKRWDMIFQRDLPEEKTKSDIKISCPQKIVCSMLSKI